MSRDGDTHWRRTELGVRDAGKLSEVVTAEVPVRRSGQFLTFAIRLPGTETPVTTRFVASELAVALVKPHGADFELKLSTVTDPETAQQEHHRSAEAAVIAHEQVSFRSFLRAALEQVPKHIRDDILERWDTSPQLTNREAMDAAVSNVTTGWPR